MEKPDNNRVLANEIVEGVRYIVTRPSYNRMVREGDTMFVSYQADNESLGKYVMFTPPRTEQPKFFGMAPLNSVNYFHSIGLVRDAIEGSELALDTEFATRKIAELEAEIASTKETYRRGAQEQATVRILVNGKETDWDQDTISYGQVCGIAGVEEEHNPTITYESRNFDGFLRDMPLAVTEGLRIYCHVTGNA